MIVLIVAAILALGGSVYHTKKSSAPKPIACTQEAKQCPDGSYVSRTGPNCEFALCPTSTTASSTAGWKTYRNEQYGFEFRYPSDWIVIEDTYPSSTHTNKDSIFNLTIQDKNLEQKKENFYDRTNMFVGVTIAPQSVLDASIKTIEDIGARHCADVAENWNADCVVSYRIINGIKAVRITDNAGEGNAIERTIELLRNGKEFQFSTGFLGIPDDNFSVATQKSYMIDNVVDTLTFTK